VGLSVPENTGGLFQSAFGTALRALPDVAVVTSDEHPQLFLRIVVLCEPNNDRCDSATSYSVAIALAEHVDSANMAAVIALGNDSMPPGLRVSARQKEALAVQTLAIMPN
jgi:hypothetical protein